MGKPKAPAPPDYAAAAREQGVANVNAAVATNFLNQPNQVSPYGSMTYTYSTPGSGAGYTTPDGQYIPQATATTTLSPEQQKLLDQNNLMSTNLNDLAIRGIGYVDSATSQPIDQSKLPSFASGLARNEFIGNADPTKLGITGQYDFSGANALPTLDEFKGQRDQITNAYMERLAPYLQRQREAQDARLATQGITQGSEAYNWDRDTLNRSENDQRIAALLAGDQAQQFLFNNALASRQQGVNEAISQGNFGNASQAQEFAQNQQGLLNRNTAAQGNFAQGLASAQFQNAARGQAIQEADYFKNQPLNMLNALRAGNQVQTPTFGNVSAGAGINAAPVYQASADQYAAAMAKYNADLQARSGVLGGITNLGSAGILASDRRLKRNIKQLGIRPDGLGVYSYDYIWGGSHIGVMADEVAALRPEALGPTIGGFATVNYGRL